MKNLKRFLVFILVLIALVLVVAIFLPSKRHVEESIEIIAPSEIVFMQVNMLEKWEPWSPFPKEDTTMVSEYQGPCYGVGSVQKWKGAKLGDGSMEITESRPPAYVRMKLDFMEKGSAVSDWKFETRDSVTKVTWTADLENLSYPLGRIKGLIMPKIMHETFRTGLADLKKLCENMITLKKNEAWQALAIKDSSSCDKIGEVMCADLAEVKKYMDDNKIECAGPAYATYFMWDTNANKFVMETGFPVKAKVAGKDRVKYIEMPANRVVSTVYYGPYELSYLAYIGVEKYIAYKKLAQVGAPWEVYLTEPMTRKDACKQMTQICFPVKKP